MDHEPEQKAVAQEADREDTPLAAGLGVGRRWPVFAGKFLLWLLGFVAVVGLILLVALRYIATPEFHERARQIAIEELEQASGGRVELSRVEWSLPRLEFELDGLTIHGTEAASEAPLLRVERVQARLKFPALLGGRIAFRELQIVRPMAHVEVFKDGSTNLPGARLRKSVRPEQVEELFRLATDKATLSSGVLTWNDKAIPLDGNASAVFIALAYRAVDNHYDGTARVGEVQLRLPEYGPMTIGADAGFHLYHDRVEVQHLRVSEGRNWVEANGAITGLASPIAQFSYHAVGDAGELSRLLHDRELQNGVVQVTGEGSYHWANSAYAFVGKAQVAGLAWSDSIMRLGKVNGGFVYSLDHDHFNVSSLFATALGGAVHGKLDVSRGEQGEGNIALAVAGIPLEQALRAFATRELPLDRLPLSGLTDGSLNVHWHGALETAQMSGMLQVRPVRRSGQLPVKAEIRATVDFQHGAVQLENLDASTDATHLSARGLLAANSNLQLDLASARLSEVAPIVAAWRGSRARDLPVEFGGPAEFRGTAQGRLQRPVLIGYLELRDFATLLHRWEKLEGDEAPVEHIVRTNWELLEGDVEYSSSRESLRNGVLREGGARIGVDASVGLVDGSYDASQPFSAHVKAANAPAEELLRMAGSAYPVTGHVSGDVQVSGTVSHMTGSGRIALNDGSAWHQALRVAQADVNFTEDQAQLRNIVVKSSLMQLAGDAHFNVETREFGFNLKGTEVKLENLPAVRNAKLRATGMAAFEVSGNGTPDAPVINGQLQLRNLAVNGQALGAMNVSAVTHGTEMMVTARSKFKIAEVKLDGQIHLRDQMPMRLSGDVQGANLNPLLESFLSLQRGAASELNAHVEAHGELRHPRDIAAELVVSRWTANYGGITVTNDGPIRLMVANEIVHVEQFRLSGENGTRFLQVHGDVQLGSKREISLRANGSVNLKLLETIDPNLMASGVADLNVQVNGTLARPLMRGRLSVQNAAVNYIDFPNGLSDVSGMMIFNEDRLQVQELTARTGGGVLHCGGFISLSEAQGVGFNLTANGREIRLRYPEGLSSTANANLTLSGSLKSAVLSGDVTVQRLGLNPQFDFAQYLAKGIRGAPAQKIDSPLNNVHMDVHVTSAPELQVQTSLAKVSGNVDLRLRGTAARPVVLGRVNLLEGTMDFNGTKYRMERGDLTFTNPVRTEPTLDVELSARVRDYDITLGFHGPITKLTPSYRSDPPLSSSDIISLLAIGRTMEETANPAMMGTSQYQPAVSESASTALLGQALNATVSSRVQRLFGVSRLKIDPNVGGALNAGLARVTVEQQISNKLTLTYITNLNQSAQQIIQFEYNVDKNVSIVGVRDQTGVVSFDVLFRKRHK